jgi:biotin carboxyl carrier protein
MKKLRITLEGKSYDVTVEVLDETAARNPAKPSAAPAPPAKAAAPVAAPVDIPGGGRVVVSPMAGLVFKCLVKPGDEVLVNQEVIVLDAMKMETPIYAPMAGTVLTVLVKEGDAVDEGHIMLHIDGNPA